MSSLSGWIMFAFVAGIVVNLIEIASATVAAGLKAKTTSLFRLESMYQVGVVAGPIIGGFLTLHWGMEAALATWAVLNIIGIVATSKIRPSLFRRKFSGGVFDAIKSRKGEFILVMAIGSFVVGFLQAIQELAFPLFMNSLGFDISLVGIVIGGASLITFVVLLYAGKKFEGRSPYASLFVLFALMLVFPCSSRSSQTTSRLPYLEGYF